MSGNETLHFSAQPRKIKKNNPKKIFYILSNGNPKKISYIFSKESCSYISVNGHPKKLIITQEVTFRAQKIKTNPLLKSFLYFGKFFKPIFLKTETTQA